jgi:flagellar biosynthesis regulator FlbT
MSLLIRLRPKEKLVVNGAVLQNESDRHGLTLVALNRINYMREREIVLPEDAITPLLKVIYWLQLAYIDPETHAESGARFMAAARALFEDETMRHPKIRFALASAIGYAANGQLAAALKALREALPHERELLGIETPAGGKLLAAAGRRSREAVGLDATIVEERPLPQAAPARPGARP